MAGLKILSNKPVNVATYGVPNPPKIKPMTQHSVLPLSTSDKLLNIQLHYCQPPTASQHTTSQSSMSNSAVHEFIGPTSVLTYSVKIVFSLADTILFAHATRKVCSCELRCCVLHTRTKSANNYGIVIVNA